MITTAVDCATARDAQEICDLVNSAYRGESSKKGWTTEADLLGGQRTDTEKIRELISKPNSVISTLRNETGAIIGCAHLEKRGDDCYLGMLTVKPTLQAGGYGKQLLKNAENYAHEVWKCQTISMSVISVRKELINWYVRHGYGITGERKPFPADDPRFGILKVKNLEFEVLRKHLET